MSHPALPAAGPAPTTNGGGTAFSAASETATVYFEARLFRVFNANASLNVYTLEAEFNALVAQPASGPLDRRLCGFTILLSAVRTRHRSPVSPLLRCPVQRQRDRNRHGVPLPHLKCRRAGHWKALAPPTNVHKRAGAYFREQGVNAGSAILGYIYAAQQTGTAQMTQIYRTDIVNKPTRPGGTAEGSTPTSNTPQENGDHVYTTKHTFETTAPGTWRVESARGFVRELTPTPRVPLPQSRPKLPKARRSSCRPPPNG